MTYFEPASDSEPTQQLPGDVFDPVSDFDPTEPLPSDPNDPQPPLQVGGAGLAEQHGHPKDREDEG